MFTKTIIRQGEKILELNAENKTLYNENKENKDYIEILETKLEHNKSISKEIINRLINLQEINKLGITENEKNKHRNVIINNIIKELASDYQSIN